MKKNRTAFLLTSLSLVLAMIACHLPLRPQLRIEVISHEDGQAVLLGEETNIVSEVFASRGVLSVDLFINDELYHTALPPEEMTPLDFIAEHPWTPEEEGPVTITIVLTDLPGQESDPVSIELDVVLAISEVDETPTPTPEGLELTQTAQAGCTNAATFVDHVTIPINAQLPAGTNFTKIWRVNNNGTCDWISYQLVHASGERLDAASPIAIPTVASGSNADLIVDMAAPNTPGTYSSVWRIRAEDGTIFGPELNLTIVVPQPPTDTPAPTPTFTVTPSPTRTPTATTPPLSVDQVSEQFTIQPNSNNNRTVTCPSGSVVVSGGFDGGEGIRVWQSKRDGNGWRITARNTTGSSIQVRVFATCLFNSGGSSSEATKQENANASDITQIDIACPSGTLVTGGGWLIGATDPIELIESSRSGNGWQIVVNNTGGSNPQFNVYAVCLAGVSGSTAQVSDTSGQIPPNDTLQLDKACPSGTLVTGGGFAVNIGANVYNTSKLANGWQNFARNTTGTQKLLHTYAICYSP